MALGRTHRIAECKWWRGFLIVYRLCAWGKFFTLVSQTCKHVVWFNCNVYYRANLNYQTSNILTHIQVQTSSHSSVNPWKTWIYNMPTVCKIWGSHSGPDEDSVSLGYVLPEVGGSTALWIGGACVPVNMMLHPRRLGSVIVISVLSVQDIFQWSKLLDYGSISRGGRQSWIYNCSAWMRSHNNFPVHVSVSKKWMCRDYHICFLAFLSMNWNKSDTVELGLTSLAQSIDLSYAIDMKWQFWYMEIFMEKKEIT